ncbi:hypothetical protein WR25_22225, partial [Diploscapter pachys]
ENSKHGEDMEKSQNEATSQRKDQLNMAANTANDARRSRDIARQNDAEKLSKLETKGKEHQDKLEADHQTRINDMKEREAEQTAEQRERLNEQMHSRRQGMAAQSNAHNQIMADTKSAFDGQKVKQDTELEENKRELAEIKKLNRDEEKAERIEYELDKREFDRERLLTQKAQIEMQLKYLNIYQTMCTTRDAKQYYANNIVPSVQKAQECIRSAESVIREARKIVAEYEAQSPSKDYKKVPDQICNSTMAACEQAMRDLHIGRNSISARAMESLKMLSKHLTKEERKEFLEVFYELEDAENELRKLCERMQINVEYRSSFDELKELIDDINEAMENLCKRIRDVPTEESVDKVKYKIEELMIELGEINENLHNLCRHEKEYIVDCEKILEDGKWKSGPTLPTKISNGIGIVCDNQLFVVDICDTGAIYQLSQNAQEWISVGRIDNNRWLSSAAVLDNKIYFTTECEVFDQNAPEGKRIRKIAKMNYDRQEHSLHWAIFEGIIDGQAYVIHYSGEPGDKANACVRRDKFEDVTEDSLIRINNGQDHFKTPFSPEEIIERAKIRLGKTSYNLVVSNCEHFAKFLRYGDHESQQAYIESLEGSVGPPVVDGDADGLCLALADACRAELLQGEAATETDALIVTLAGAADHRKSMK